MKNFNIMGVCWKIRLLGGGGGGGVPKKKGKKRGGGGGGGGGGFPKNQWLKRGGRLDSFQIWGGLAKKEGRGLIP